ncbi:MAG: hypothetical protein ABT07_03755 [Microbacterium sp. SCN 70-10]|nr:MAG: hypothetical protein ABT07_03755 [Microbacterium sp. SCN 70-10]
MERLPDVVRSARGDIEGTVGVGMSSTLASFLAGPLMDACRTEFPRIKLRLITADSIVLKSRLDASQLDLAVVFVPILRPVRLLGALTRLTSFTRTAGSSVRAQLIIYGLGSVSLLIWQVALVVLQAERHTPGANILTFGDAIWWAVCTVTTVGYGDYAPVTVTGRLAAVVLMAGGVVLVGLIVATISSWASERVAQAHERKRAQASDADHPRG